MNNKKITTEEQRKEIKRLFFEEGVREYDLSERFKVSQSTISHIVNDYKRLSKVENRRRINERHLYGEEHPMVKLTKQEVEEIRKLWSLGYKQKDIAKLYGVCQGEISLVVNYKRRTR